MACTGWDSIDPNCHAEEAAGSMLDKVLQAFSDMAMASLEWSLSWWMKIPTPSPFNQSWDGSGGIPGDLRLMPALASVWSSLGFISAVVMILLALFMIGKAAWNNDVGEFRSIAAMILRYIAVVTFGVPLLWMLIKFSDGYAPWIMDRALADGSSAATAETFVKQGSIISLGFGAGIIMGILIFLGAILQVGFMLIRGVLLLILIAAWGVAAAGTGSEAGMQAFKKINAWFLAFVLYKPAAATIYALGTALLTQNQLEPRGDVGGESGEAFFQVLMAIIMIGAAALALPALIKFMSPPAGLGASSAFSGGAAMGAIATGAIAIGTMGAGSAAMGAGAVAPTGAATEALPPSGGGPAGTPGGSSPAGTPGGADPTAGPGGASDASPDVGSGSGPSGSSSSGSSSSGSDSGSRAGTTGTTGSGSAPAAGGEAGKGGKSGSTASTPATTTDSSAAPSTGAASAPTGEPALTSSGGTTEAEETPSSSTGSKSGPSLSGLAAAGQLGSAIASAPSKAIDEGES